MNLPENKKLHVTETIQGYNCDIASETSGEARIH